MQESGHFLTESMHEFKNIWMRKIQMIILMILQKKKNKILARRPLDWGQICLWN